MWSLRSPVATKVRSYLRNTENPEEKLIELQTSHIIFPHLSAALPIFAICTNLKKWKMHMEEWYCCRLKPATLLKVTLIHGNFSRFLNCANDTKSRKASIEGTLNQVLSFFNETRWTWTHLWLCFHFKPPENTGGPLILVFRRYKMGILAGCGLTERRKRKQLKLEKM